MRWSSTLSRATGAADAFAEAADAVQAQLDGAAPDLLLVFASPHHAEACDVVGRLAAQRFPRALVVGCTGGGVIGGAREAEEGPALSLTAASLPGAALAPLRLDPQELRDGAPDAAGWRARVGLDGAAAPKFLLLADPFTLQIQEVIEGLGAAYPGAPTFGGLASGGQVPGENRLFLGGEVHRDGGVGVVFSGDLAVDTLVAQGCRPIGEPMVVTRCQRSLLQELDGRPPMEVLRALYRSLDVRDRELMEHSLFVGLEQRAGEAEGERGELLVRNLVGTDPRTGALAVGAELMPLSVVQFVLRDAHSAEQELRELLVRHRRAAAGRPAGALLFSCLGRGAGLFGHPDHDTSLFEEQLGPAPLGGFFCNGEIGPVGGTTFLHGYTSAFALFREARGGS